MRMKVRFFAAAAAVLLLCQAVLAEPVRFPGYVWDAPLKFNAVQELGPDAYLAAYPAEAGENEAKIELIVISTPRESVATMQEGGANPKTLALATFMGLTGRPEQINKALFLGETEARLVYEADFPRPHIVHIFQKMLDDGSMVTVALRNYGAPPAEFGQALQALSDTFRVSP